MRRMLLVLVASSVAACANDVTAPTTVPSPENSLTAVTNDAAGPWGFGRRGFGMMGGGLMFARRLPPSLQLSAPQRTQIRSLMSAYRASHKDDFEALASVAKQARAAHASGMRVTVEQRHSFFAQTAPARQRLVTANKTLRAQIQQVLTTDQRSWLASHRPRLRRTDGVKRRWSSPRSNASGSTPSTNS